MSSEDSAWPAIDYRDWSATCDTLHAHAQVLGKLAVALAPPEPELEHAALRLTARGWETSPLPAPDGSGALVVGLDLHAHEAFIEHGDGRRRRAPLTPNRAVGEVTREVLSGIRELVGRVVIDPAPQEVWWTAPLDEDREHATYDPVAVARYLVASSQAALVLSAFRAPYRGRLSRVDAWWGSFDLGVHLFSGRAADPPADDFITRNSMDAEQAAVGWWPGDPRYEKAAFYAFAFPAPPGMAGAQLSPAAARWDQDLGEYLLDWNDVRSSPDPAGGALEFARSVFRHTCTVCGWDEALLASVEGSPPPIT
jgi:hypothetical protein